MNAYGCVRCQTHHTERDPLYREHIYSQSKHGIYRLSERDWALAKLTLRDAAAARLATEPTDDR